MRKVGVANFLGTLIEAPGSHCHWYENLAFEPIETAALVFLDIAQTLAEVAPSGVSMFLGRANAASLRAHPLLQLQVPKTHCHLRKDLLWVYRLPLQTQGPETHCRQQEDLTLHSEVT